MGFLCGICVFVAAAAPPPTYVCVCVSVCFVLFWFAWICFGLVFYWPVCFLKREEKAGVRWWGGREEMRDEGGGEFRIYWVKLSSI